MMLAMVVLMLVLWPIYDHFVETPRFDRALHRGDPDARVHLYRRAIVRQWAIVVVMVASLVMSGVRLGTVGVTMPGLRALGTLALIIVYGAMGFRKLRRLRRDPAARDRIRTAMQHRPVTRVIARSARERVWIVPLSITAGACEEFLYRGVAVATLRPWIGIWLAVLVSAIAFGLVHAYQGRGGIAQTALVGLVMSGIVAASGSLIPAMALHALVDIVSLSFLSVALRDDVAPATIATTLTAATIT